MSLKCKWNGTNRLKNNAKLKFNLLEMMFFLNNASLIKTSNQKLYSPESKETKIIHATKCWKIKISTKTTTNRTYDL